MSESTGIAVGVLREFDLSTNKTNKTKRRKLFEEERARTNRQSVVQHLPDFRTEVLDGGNVRRVHSIEVERRFGFVGVVDDLDLQRIVGLEVLAVDGDLHAADERRLEIDARLHQRTLRFRRVKRDLRHSRANQRDESRRKRSFGCRMKVEVTCERIDISSSIPPATDRTRILEKRSCLEESAADGHRSASHADCSACR